MRPKLTNLPKDKFDQFLEWTVWLSIAIILGLLLTHYPSLPDIIPDHFDGQGNVNSTGHKNTILSVALISIASGVGLFFLSKSPHMFNYPVTITDENAPEQYRNAQRTLRIVNAIITVMMAYIVYGIIQNARGLMDGLGPWFLPLVLLLVLGSIGFTLWKAYRLR